MTMETKKEYTAPMLTVVSFKVENGFVNTGIFESFTLWEQTLDGNDHQVEDYSQASWHDNFWGNNN